MVLSQVKTYKFQKEQHLAWKISLDVNNWLLITILSAEMCVPRAASVHNQHSSFILVSWAVWQVLGGVNTEGSAMPGWMSKKRVEVVTL